MILIGVGANLASPRFGAPVATCAAALDALINADVRVLRRSRWYRSDPVPASDQPPYINGVAQVTTALEPGDLLTVMHRVETDLGRWRYEKNEPRVVDLDLLAYGNRVTRAADKVRLPHPRLHERHFVLRPLAEIAPSWRHPVLGRSAVDLLDILPAGQVAEPLETA